MTAAAREVVRLQRDATLSNGVWREEFYALESKEERCQVLAELHLGRREDIEYPGIPQSDPSS